MCSAELIFLDVDTGQITTPDFTIETTNITFTTLSLPVNSYYDMTIIASNDGGSATFSGCFNTDF